MIKVDEVHKGNKKKMIQINLGSGSGHRSP